MRDAEQRSDLARREVGAPVGGDQQHAVGYCIRFTSETTGHRSPKANPKANPPTSPNSDLILDEAVVRQRRAELVAGHMGEEQLVLLTGFGPARWPQMWWPAAR
jgi:hypothetical protein